MSKRKNTFDEFEFDSSGDEDLDYIEESDKSSESEFDSEISSEDEEIIKSFKDNEIVKSQSINKSELSNLEDSENEPSEIDDIQSTNKDDIWNHFEIKNRRRRCNLKINGTPCTHDFSVKTGITTLKYHLSNHHSIDFDLRNSKTLKKPNPEIDELVVDWIVDDTQPFHVVENEKFKKLIERLNPHYKLIREKKVKKIVDSKYELISEEKLEYLRGNSGKAFL
jgi:hypothetical protein